MLNIALLYKLPADINMYLALFFADTIHLFLDEVLANPQLLYIAAVENRLNRSVIHAQFG